MESSKSQRRSRTEGKVVVPNDSDQQLKKVKKSASTVVKNLIQGPIKSDMEHDHESQRIFLKNVSEENTAQQKEKVRKNLKAETFISQSQQKEVNWIQMLYDREKEEEPVDRSIPKNQKCWDVDKIR